MRKIEKVYFREKDKKNYLNYDEIEPILTKEKQDIIQSWIDSKKDPLKTYIYWMIGIDIFILTILPDLVKDPFASILILICIVIPLQFILCPTEVKEYANKFKSNRDFSEELKVIEIESVNVKKFFGIELSDSEKYIEYEQKYNNLGNEIKSLSLNRHYIEKRVDFKNMTGWEFEQFTEKLLIDLGYREVKMTSRLGTNHTYKGDGGIDLTAIDSSGKKVAIQCKNTSLVSNDIISRTHGAKDLSMYRCEYALVITSGKFTVPAEIEARDLGVEIWDGEVLKKKILLRNK